MAAPTWLGDSFSRAEPVRTRHYCRQQPLRSSTSANFNLRGVAGALLTMTRATSWLRNGLRLSVPRAA